MSRSHRVEFPGLPYLGSDRRVLRRVLATLRRIRDRAKDGRTGLHTNPENVRHSASVAAGTRRGTITPRRDGTLAETTKEPMTTPKTPARSLVTVMKDKSAKLAEQEARATATLAMEELASEAFTAALASMELPKDPKGEPARKVKLKLTDGVARITVRFEIEVKTRKK